MNTLLYLVFGHYIGDYALQGEYIAREKANSLHVLVAHCAIQAGTVLLATNEPGLALIEFGIHAIVDTAKCRGIISFNLDQAIHLLCRVFYAISIWYR